MEEDIIIKKKKNNYRRHHNNHNHYYYKNKKKKNLITDNNDTREIKNILLFNEEQNIKKEEVKEVVQVISDDTPDYDLMDVVPKKVTKNRFNLMNKALLKYGAGFAVLLIAIFGTSYSFFNYTKEDVRQADISAGEVYVRLVENSQSITLNKMYPRTNEEARSRNDNYFDFTIKAKNTSPTKAVLYSFSITNGEDVTGKTRINPEYISIDLQEKVNNNYVYIKEGVKLSSYDFSSIIPVNTVNEMTKEYRLRIWVNDSIIISDTDPNASYTQAQFNNLYANFNVAVNSEDKEMAYSLFAQNVDTETTINFANNSSASNGQGLYILPGTENNNFPIYYYRGEIDNNNVVFGGYCWQIVRTTDTGGIKMIYNGDPTVTESESGVSYDCGSTRPIGRISEFETQRNIGNSTGYYFADDYEIVGTSGANITYRLKSKTNPITQVSIANASDAASKIPTIAANYPYTCARTTSDGTCPNLFKVESYDSGLIANGYAATAQSAVGWSEYHLFYPGSIADIGYMSNKRYTSSSGVTTGAIYGKDVEWDGTNYLVIEDTANTPSTNTTKDNNHHYSCATSGTTSCRSVRYYYYNDYYILLTSGDTVEDALYKMTGNGSLETKQKNSSYVLNNNDSDIKKRIDNWFEEKLTNVADNTKPDYRLYLEDTVFCNDRSFKTEVGSSVTFEQSGWNKTGGDLTKTLNFGSMNRAFNGWYSTTNVPSTICPNESDRFTVLNRNGNGKLTYPVGLLTVDEMVMAGASGNGSYNYTYYLYTGQATFSMSPRSFGNDSSFIFEIYYHGELDFASDSLSISVRPVISLKLGTVFEPTGNGTPTNPYVVKYN